MLWVLVSLLPLITLAGALPQVKLGKATVVGQDVSDKVEFFGGIPFAEPPLGELRLKPPVLKTQLPPTTFNASSYGNACIQPPFFGLPAPPQSEDCLSINIFRPAGIAPTARLPILFWTYGGGFALGSSRLFDAKDLVARSIERGTPLIYVNYNYRLGPLGFPQGKEAGDVGALNLGLRDQLAALEWVQANIHAFGGDKNEVTIFGESAGAVSTGILYLNSRLEKLARAAIFESGTSNALPAFPAARNDNLWKGFVEKIPSCSSLASSGHTFTCLKRASIEEITAAINDSAEELRLLLWGPTLDAGRGGIYSDYPSRLYEKGHFARLPFIAGTNRDEGTLFAIQTKLSYEDLKDMLVIQHSPAITSQVGLNSTVDTILELYPDDPAVGSPYGTGAELFGLPSSYKRHASLFGDITFAAPRRQWSQAAAKAGVKSYGYLFTQPQPSQPLGVTHGAEVPYVYAQPPPTDSAGQGISAIIVDYWISFTVSLDPNDGRGVKRPEWPQYTTKNQVLLQLEGGNTTVIKDDFRKEQIGFLIKNSLILRR
ncbi:triacylglycerol lipase 3 [Ephemerocybe angulata]|uniref:Carboxylic ester hydrolase n=1 Tax=Ephemerocybe angulata TaxID=980116 RepID=A0A8H6LY65_9AGAR|nr:triacylglycerol lipase 3 [Tulosesus angulatus]